MGRILAWQSDETGELFATKHEYQSHLRRLARTRLYRRKLDKEQSDFAEFVDPLHAMTNITDIQKWIVENSERLMRQGALDNHRHWNGKGQPKDKNYGLSYFTLDHLRWSEKTSNSHHAPKGKETNWGGSDTSLPRGYPGWHGHVSFSLAEQFDFSSDIFPKIGIHTGTGGGGGKTYSYECFMFAEEWPSLFVTEKLYDRLGEGVVLK